MEGSATFTNFVSNATEAWNPSTTHHFSHTNYPLLLAEQVERVRAEAERVRAAAERCRVAASYLEYTPCTEVYNGGENCNGQLENVSLTDTTFNRESAAGPSSGHANIARHVSPVIAAFAVQCAKCLKWRLMPSKEQYEAIRACLLERPWFCEDACPWRPTACCDDPADIVPDEKYLWAVDKPNISVPPPGWNRQFVIRSQGSSKLGDIYYISPCGKKLRSMMDVDRFLNEHPHYVREGVNRDRFSYKTPKPLFDGYVGKRKSSHEFDADGPIRKMRGAQKFQTNNNTTQVKRFASMERGESSSMFDIQRPLLPLFPLVPQFSKRKRSTRIRPTEVITNWNM